LSIAGLSFQFNGNLLSQEKSFGLALVFSGHPNVPIRTMIATGALDATTIDLKL